MTLGKLLDETWKIIVFIVIQYSLGRRGSYPYGLLVKFSLLKITIIVVISDMIQTVILLNLLDFFSRKISWFKKWRERATEKEKTRPPNSFRAKLKKYGPLGLVIVAALPYGGGALTGSIVAFSMKLDKKRSFLFITLGCIIGSILFYLGFAGVLALARSK
jgi:uncharacterized membrane protein